MEKPYNHISVLLNESIQQLNIKKNGVYVDCTLGGGGHSSEILKRIPNGHLYAFDQDSFAINTADEKLKKIASNYTLINENFVNIKVALEEENVYGVDGILYDLGVSSFQLDIPERGFSYRFDGPLDMRMDQTAELDAYTVVNTYDEKSLVRILFEYGEEKFARLIARKIVSEREKKPIETTLELVEIIKKALPASALRNSSHPAKQTFQAIRIEVNHELDILKKALEDGLSLLNKNGRMVVITFHSLEDRIVKKLFKEKTTLQLPKDLPYIPEGYEIEFKLINSKVILPSESEISNNLRSHSAKMRVIEKI
ncbi:MAG: 16S rRNA (cytosine(1402)-N(4))-methyltransferase RsmH [Acholeplasmatales bacterium]|jgi:S-adenosyl-methyltransferase mraW|nr:16S rRNA (cytosine(1402)-N(4))-methyltransferase RsmH [Acholeplasmatales bacterium]CDD21648.1 ribosomal RNA small subunit methyltransferase H [Firmicutes bacterium CAG:313]HCX07668.1 16S rRNA (cytosine(1402)-N(4))-methyltransferase RsmH [Acholeplasmatales bacterium]